MATTRAKKQTKTTAPVRFSLVPEAAQHRMYSALQTLHSSAPESPSGCEAVEAAAALAMAEHDAVLLYSAAHGARLAGRGVPCSPTTAEGEQQPGLAAAVAAAVEQLAGDAKASALICAGAVEKLEPKELRSVLAFIGRHKLPILILVGNRITPGRPQPHDLHTLHAECGVPVFSVAAEDAIAGYRVATEALHNARRQRGGALIEALTVQGSQQRPDGALELLRAYMQLHGTRPL
jgi:TPP-dependent pyruvate/acetoin dehydrogenase alpha subunit